LDFPMEYIEFIVIIYLTKNPQELNFNSCYC